MKKYDGLSVQDLIDDPSSGPIFVLNTSDKVTRGGDVFISINVGTATRPIKVPRTWVPIEMTRTVPRKSILESVHFMEAVARGLVRIISREEAKKIEARSGYDPEMARLRDREDAVRLEGMARGIGKNVTVVSPNGGEDAPEAKSINVVAKKGVSVVSLDDDQSEGEPTVSATFVAWVNKLNGMDEDQAFNAMRVKSTLEYEECLYMIESCVHQRIQKFLKKRV